MKNYLKYRLLSHLPFLVILAGGIALRIIAELAYRPALWFSGDSYFYLLDAHTLSPTSFHPFGYALFIRALSLLGPLTTITIAQHLLGLIAAILIYVVLLRRGVSRWLAAISTIPILLDGYVIDLESMLLTEALVGFLLVLIFVLLFWNKRPSNLQLGCIGLCLALATITRESAEVLIIPIIAYVVYIMLNHGVKNIKKLLPPIAILMAVFLFPLLIYAGYHYRSDKDFTIDNKTPFYLYAKLMPIANCSSLDKQEKLVCYNKAGIKPNENNNWYLWSGDSPLRQNFTITITAYNVPEGVLKKFDVAILKKQTPSYLKSVMYQTAQYFGITAIHNPQDSAVANWQFPTRDVWTPYVWLSRNTYTPMVQTAHVPLPDKRFAYFLHSYQRYVFLPGPIMGIGVVLSLLALIIRRNRYAIMSAVMILSGIMYLVLTSALAALIYRYIIPVEEIFFIGMVLAIYSFMSKKET